MNREMSADQLDSTSPTSRHAFMSAEQMVDLQNGIKPAAKPRPQGGKAFLDAGQKYNLDRGEKPGRAWEPTAKETVEPRFPVKGLQGEKQVNAFTSRADVMLERLDQKIANQEVREEAQKAAKEAEIRQQEAVRLKAEIKKQEAEAKKLTNLLTKIDGGERNVTDIAESEIVRLHYHLKDRGALIGNFTKKQIEQRYQEITSHAVKQGIRGGTDSSLEWEDDETQSELKTAPVPFVAEVSPEPVAPVEKSELGLAPAAIVTNPIEPENAAETPDIPLMVDPVEFVAPKWSVDQTQPMKAVRPDDVSQPKPDQVNQIREDALGGKPPVFNGETQEQVKKESRLMQGLKSSGLKAIDALVAGVKGILPYWEKDDSLRGKAIGVAEYSAFFATGIAINQGVNYLYHHAEALMPGFTLSVRPLIKESLSNGLTYLKTVLLAGGYVGSLGLTEVANDLKEKNKRVGYRTAQLMRNAAAGLTAGYITSGVTRLALEVTHPLVEGAGRAMGEVIHGEHKFLERVMYFIQHPQEIFAGAASHAAGVHDRSLRGFKDNGSLAGAHLSGGDVVQPEVNSEMIAHVGPPRGLWATVLNELIPGGVTEWKGAGVSNAGKNGVIDAILTSWYHQVSGGHNIPDRTITISMSPGDGAKYVVSPVVANLINQVNATKDLETYRMTVKAAVDAFVANPSTLVPLAQP